MTGLSDPTSFNPTAAPGDTTTYLASISEGGCTEMLTLQLNVIPAPIAAFSSSDASGCAPHPMSFSDLSDDATFHIWNFGDGSPVSNSPHPMHTYTRPGDYVVTHTTVGVGGCSDVATSVTVHAHDTLHPAFTSDPDYPAILQFPMTEVAFFDQTDGAAHIEWDFGDGIVGTETNPIHRYLELGQYYVTLTAWTVEGCMGRVVHGPYTVMPSELFVPNNFSPNGDGINDYFMVNYTGSQPFTLSIFDRWGVQYFNTKDKLAPWDGKTTKGDAVPEGVYFYVATVGDKSYTGPVTLIR